MATLRPYRRRELALPLLGAAVLSLLASAGCEEYGPRVYTAREYRPAERCIEASVSLGVVRTDELTSNCATCLQLDTTVYVSKVCPPHPPQALVLDPAESAECADALALLAANTGCAPEGPVDAGASDGG